MNKLKKGFAAAGAVCLIACWPLVIGQIGQRVAEDNLSHVHNSSIDITLLKYDRGYFSSDAQFKVTITNPTIKSSLETEKLPTDYIFNSHLSHGLWSISGVTEPENKTALPLKIVSDTQLNGNTELVSTLDSIVYKGTQSPWDVTISPSTVKTTITVLGEVNYDVDVPSLQLISKNGENINFNNLTLVGDGKQLNHFWIGKGTLGLDSLIYSTSAQPNVIQSHDISFSMSSNIDSEMTHYNSHHELKVGDITTQSGEIINGEIDVEIGGLDATLLDQLAALSEQASAKTHDDSVLLKQKMVATINDLVAKGLYVNVNKLGLSYKDGKMSNEVKLSVPANDSQEPADLAKVITSLEGNAASSVDKALAKDFPNLQSALDELVVMEMATDTGNSYQIKADIKDGNVLFPNGQKTPIISLLFPLLVQ
ncbi:DUF945 family protein [Vibrio viridaestus]|uniref:DUF945 family protein n=1 Tax=Vibrio viridaestus TaxID=2487322 RepID=A0A3N9TII6_9VIBR|nr:DUF945 family protein [Vibrio viridaestus]RQW63355.1 DUF945 family protein [Vibrio viridaestus]